MHAMDTTLSNRLSLTSPTAGRFITALIFFGLLIDVLMAFFFCMVWICSSFVLGWRCMITTVGSHRFLDWPCLSESAPSAPVDDDQINDSDESCAVRPAEASAPLLPESPFWFGMPSFPKVPCCVFRGGKGEAIVCAVCQNAIDDLELAVALPFCGHLFHVECVDPWLKEHLTCPNCRVCISDTPTTTATMARTVVETRT